MCSGRAQPSGGGRKSFEGGCLDAGDPHPRIAERARCATPKSSNGRLFKQAQTAFPGVERVEVGELARALDRRPLPAALADGALMLTS